MSFIHLHQNYIHFHSLTNLFILTHCAPHDESSWKGLLVAKCKLYSKFRDVPTFIGQIIL